MIGEFSAEETAKKEIRLVRAIDELALYSEDHSVLFNMIVTDILVSPSRLARGGSTSLAIGAIWANPDPTFTINDVMEILVHELTHHTMFLDELRYGHYFYSNVIDRSSWARSAILKSVRPLDKVLHSIVVAVEVLLFRCRCTGHPIIPRVHPPTEMLVTQLQYSIYSAEQVVLRNGVILQPRALALLANAKRILTDQLNSVQSSTLLRSA